jgi:ubiquinone/menaquinone biosynthesis C-methylase UbiE
MAYYDDFNYEKYWQGRDYEDLAERIALKKLIPKNQTFNDMIEVGCGFGRMASFYHSLFRKCTLIDPSTKLLGEAKENLKEVNNLEFVCATANKTTLDNHSVDLCLMIRVCHHLPDLEPSLKEINRILKPKGFLVLEFANKINLKARIRSCLRGDFQFAHNQLPIDLRSSRKRNEKYINFSAHHPNQVLKILKRNGFTPKKILSVSNFRQPIIKKIVPQKILLVLENFSQEILGKFFFGPSIFVLCQKSK